MKTKTKLKKTNCTITAKMNAMTSICFIIVLFIISGGVFGQLPAFPSIEDAYAKVKLSDFAEEILKETGLPHTAFKMLPKTQYMSELNGNANIDKTYFNAYASKRSEELFYKSAPNYPKDECDIYFCAVSPKKGDEEYKSVSFKVVYSRLNNDALGQAWKLKKIKYTGFYIYNKKQRDSRELAKEVLDVLMLTKAGSNDEVVNFNGSEVSVYPSFADFAKIDSITLNTEFTDLRSFNVFGVLYTPFTPKEAYYQSDKPATLTPYVFTIRVSYNNHGGKETISAIRNDWSGQNTANTVVTDKKYKTGETADFKEIYQKFAEE